MTWSVIVHGGAKAISPEEAEAHRHGCLAAVDAARTVLHGGGSAVDAAVAAVRSLEDDPTFNAGYGSVLNADGDIEMDAALMDGATLDVGAVAGIKGVRHPVAVARALLPERPILLVGDAARRFAADQGAELCPPEAMIAPNRLRAARDTVGCVARDATGNLAAATSTGGLTEVTPGRVGDSPLPGCGYYADNRVGAVAFSGEGEEIARVILAARVIGEMERAGPEPALKAMLPLLTPLGGDGGGIAIDRNGRIGWAHNSPQFAVALARAGEDARVFIEKPEEGTTS